MVSDPGRKIFVYLQPKHTTNFAADPRRLFLIGVTFSTEERRIKEYLIEPVSQI